MNLSIEQQAKTIIYAEGQSRRRAKRYLKDHGGAGTAAELDAVLAAAQADSEVRRAVERLRSESRLNAERAAESQRLRKLAHHCRVICAAAEGRWQRAVRLVWSEVEALPIGYSREQAVREAMSAMSVSAAVVAERIEADGLTPELDDSIAGAYESVLATMRLARDDALEDALVEDLRRRGREGQARNARFAVFEYYRKTMNSDGNCESLAFDERADAALWIALCGFSGSSYNAAIIDRDADQADGDDQD